MQQPSPHSATPHENVTLGILTYVGSGSYFRTTLPLAGRETHEHWPSVPGWGTLAEHVHVPRKQRITHTWSQGP